MQVSTHTAPLMIPSGTCSRSLAGTPVIQNAHEADLDIGLIALLIRHLYREHAGVLNGHCISVVVTHCSQGLAAGGGLDLNLRVIVHDANLQYNDMNVMISKKVGLLQKDTLITMLGVEAERMVNNVLGGR
jgi:hypothetical protein